ncbi:MAG TPA: potassium-transporting ATPase subunit KdpA [Thermomicrobiales bacterium]|nr:potassium-transporting ATPase subunit KdpA [Thermomicrobiales bacterium]
MMQFALFLAIVLLLAKPVGWYMHRVFEGGVHPLGRVFGPFEWGIYRVIGANPAQEMKWSTYAVALLLFNASGALLLYFIMRFQGSLPLNPQNYPDVESRLAFNTAVSFVTNTNWQSYASETTMSNFTQMVGLAVQNFMSAATGIAIAIALIRGFVRRSASEIGNFWVDVTRSVLYVLLPISIVAALIFVARGIPQNFDHFTSATTLSGVAQTIAQGPVASQEAIKLLGTNGGGFFNANSAHPFENPTPFTNLLEMALIFLIPAGLTATFGKMVGNAKQGWAILAVMTLLFTAGVAVTTSAEQGGNPLLAAAGASQSTEIAGVDAPGGNMEGKETRFGISASSLFAVVTTAASCGAVNAMHDSFTPLGGLAPLANIGLGEVIFGGVGAGLYGILVYAVIAIFIAGLMVGRTPEYLGKKIEAYDIKMAMLTLLVIPLVILSLTGVSLVIGDGLAAIWNPGPHGLTEVFYAYTSAAGNNGSAFAGLGANVPWYNVTLGIAMLAGRFLMIVPVLALAGSLARKQRLAETSGTFPTTGPLWIGLLAGVIVIVGALTYFPAYALGPIIEHYAMHLGSTFGG